MEITIGHPSQSHKLAQFRNEKYNTADTGVPPAWSVDNVIYLCIPSINLVDGDKVFIRSYNSSAKWKIIEVFDLILELLIYEGLLVILDKKVDNVTPYLFDSFMLRNVKAYHSLFDRGN